MRALLDAIGRPELADDPRFSSRGPRTQHAAALNAIIEEWTCSRTTGDVVRELFDARGVPAVRVRTPLEALRDRATVARGAVMTLAHPLMGNVHAFGMGNPIQFSGARAQFDEPAQTLGAATDEVLTTLLNLSPRELAELRRANVI
jgi:crotonobetainyl-CoA:carnitine CoA-transferase CaiB-like acyl-CoA transferase